MATLLPFPSLDHKVFQSGLDFIVHCADGYQAISKGQNSVYNCFRCGVYVDLYTHFHKNHLPDPQNPPPQPTSGQAVDRFYGSAIAPQLSPVKKCGCSLIDLMKEGCTCGGI